MAYGKCMVVLRFWVWEIWGWKFGVAKVGGAFGGTKGKVGWVGVVVFTLGMGI